MSRGLSAQERKLLVDTNRWIERVADDADSSSSSDDVMPVLAASSRRPKKRPLRKRAAPKGKTPAKKAVASCECDKSFGDRLEELRQRETFLVFDVPDERLAPDVDLYACPICTENKIRVRIGPCGHCVCVACAKHMWGTEARQCPHCRGTMGQLSEIFV